MRDFYDRLEAQLGQLTECGAHLQGRPRLRLPSVGISPRLLALATAPLIVIAIAMALLSTGASRHGPHLTLATPVGAKPPPVLRNIYPSPLPAPSGSFTHSALLTGSKLDASAAGEVWVYAMSSGRSEIQFRARGLRPAPPGDVYVVWLRPATQMAGDWYVLQNGQAPELLGVIEASARSAGNLTVDAPLLQGLSGPYEMLVTVQPAASLKAPGAVLLKGGILV